MKIVMFSITPLFPDHDLGGAQKHLRHIARHLAERGHDVTLLCTRRADTPEAFDWHPRAHVRAILDYRQPFPAPYAVPAYQLASIVQAVGDHLVDADRFYMHDGEFLFPYVYQHLPTVVSVRDNVYPETIQGAFGFAAHRLIVISDYARRFFLHTVGRFFPELPERMQVITNGLDWSRFQPTPPGRILELLPGVDPARDWLILHPHRPEENKGLWETIEVVDRLVHQHGLTQIRTLVPRWVGVENDPGVADFYARAEALIAARGLTDHFVFHPWIAADLVPEYYSLGRVMFSLGSFAESFGNAVYEAYGCGTPVVVARISTHRELLPDALAFKVDYGDHDAAAALAARLLIDGTRTPPETIAFLHAHYHQRRQLDAFAEVIENAQLAEPMRYRHPVIGDDTRWRLAPWCYRSAARGVFHDYLAAYQDDPTLLGVIDAYPDGFTLAQAAGRGIARAPIDAWTRGGWLVMG